MDNRFLTMTKMCLNNWHYINRKILSYQEAVNFFTGHSGSGKSTVIDALQMILYADTTGRGFFNKAAKEDSNRTLIEYLRGMVRIEENNTAKYLRNRNFSATVVIEFQDSQTSACQCIGAAFDVDTDTNNISKLWFWHSGSLFENEYRGTENRPFTIEELKNYMKSSFSSDEYFQTVTDIKFRNEIYGNYFGGLPAERFIALFKKAIPFKMDMKLDDFIKNYIFTEVNIHIEDMKDSVTQYSNLKLKLEDTKQEIVLLKKVKEQYQKYVDCCNKEIQCRYNLDQLEMKAAQLNLKAGELQLEALDRDMEQLHDTSVMLNQQILKMQEERDEIAGLLSNSGYNHLQEQLRLLQDNIEILQRSKSNYDKLVNRLSVWKNTDLLEPETMEAIRSFEQYQANRKEAERIRGNIAQVKVSLGDEKDELKEKINQLRKNIEITAEEVEELNKGHKNYSRTLLEAKEYLSEGLTKYYGKPVPVDILADVIEVKREAWQNAIEGYLGGGKTTLMVHPDYVNKAMELYRGLDARRFYQVSVADTEKVSTKERKTLPNSLAQEVGTATDYVRAYIDYLLGSVIKCETVEELRANNGGITKDCVLYQGYQLQHIDPRNYTDYAYIGQGAIAKRLIKAQDALNTLKNERIPLDRRSREISEILGYESFSDISNYEQWKNDCQMILKKEKERQESVQKLEDLKKTDLSTWQERLLKLDASLENMRTRKSQTDGDLRTKGNKQSELKEIMLSYQEELFEKQKTFIPDPSREAGYQSFMADNEGKKTDFLKNRIQNEIEENREKKELEFSRVIEKRQAYYDRYNYRGFSVSSYDNKEYEEQLAILDSEKLAEFTEKANKQAMLAIYHFKTDFVYKIRAAIVDAQKQKNDLNHVLEQLDFGKDQYSFRVTKNTGEEGKFYDMFINKDLEINPKQLGSSMEGQEDLFTLKHESEYNDLINELLEMFMPPANSDAKTLEAARMNMERYCDYRTYLSFDMFQRVNGGPPTSLTKMLSKNSGGEGQNPLYVALLASFAQIYRISMDSKTKRRPTPRLVVLDEAFSKMDAEKVATCITLINSLQVQAIISAPNDKIQNYTENVNKIFLFANQNKTHISIEEFEQERFYELMENTEED